jgi:hypothetical protein
MQKQWGQASHGRHQYGIRSAEIDAKTLQIVVRQGCLARYSVYRAMRKARWLSIKEPTGLTLVGECGSYHTGNHVLGNTVRTLQSFGQMETGEISCQLHL